MDELQSESEMKRIFGSILIVGFLSCGCSTAPQTDYSKVDLVSVSGTVTLDGKPLAAAVVTFESPIDGTFSFGQADNDGAFTLQFDSVKDGCTTGKKLVRFSTTRRILGLNSDEEEGGSDEAGETSGEAAGGAAKELVPDCYNQDSKLMVEVSSAATDFRFDLKSDCSTTGATAP